MGAIRLRPSLVATIALSLALLIGAVFGLGMAIERGIVEPPELDWQLGIVRITAYRTTTPECPPHICRPTSHETPQAHYVVWLTNELVPEDQPYRRMTRYVFVVPSRR
jgi:hypothetical protein